MSVIDGRFRSVANIDANHGGREHRAEMMRDKSVAAADIEDRRSARNDTRDLQRHVVCTANFAAPAFAKPATSDAFNELIEKFLAPPPRTLGLYGESVS